MEVITSMANLNLKNGTVWMFISPIKTPKWVQSTNKTINTIKPSPPSSTSHQSTAFPCIFARSISKHPRNG